MNRFRGPHSDDAAADPRTPPAIADGDTLEADPRAHHRGPGAPHADRGTDRADADGTPADAPTAADPLAPGDEVVPPGPPHRAGHGDHGPGDGEVDGHGHDDHGPGDHGAPPPISVDAAVAAIFEHFDIDDSAVIAVSELLAVLDPLGRHADAYDKVTAVFATLDLDHDGALDTAEVKAAVTALDTNADGTLDGADHDGGPPTEAGLIGVMLHEALHGAAQAPGA